MDALVSAVFSKEGLFAVMFFLMFTWQLNQYKSLQDEAKLDKVRMFDDMKDRENKLMDFLQDITKQFERLVKQYEALNDEVHEIKNELKDNNDNRKVG